MNTDFIFKARLKSVHDGDTATFTLDLGFRIYFDVEIRLESVMAPELSQKYGDDARLYLESLLHAHPYFWIKTQKTKSGKLKQSFTRYLGLVLTPDMDSINFAMISYLKKLPG